ncbi:hypothetical protein ON010_g13758 [Phytophthora cinnamomi]|nr:hypothetical protein ON010_g13758 [Phytophthora cinnamomi]
MLVFEVVDAEDRIARAETEKASLRLELDQLKSNSIEEEVKADKSKATARRQEEEVRSLKQAVKKAHELYQKVCWQLEQEVQEKSALQTVVNHLRRQREQTEREIREEKLRELEKSFNEAEDDDLDEATGYQSTTTTGLYALRGTKSTNRKPASPTMRSQRKSPLVPVIDVDDSSRRGGSPRRRCENSMTSLSDLPRCASPSASVSPLSPRASRTASRRSEEVERFLSEWQQLDVTKALSDSPPAGREVRFRGDASDTSRRSPVKSPASPTSAVWDETRQTQSQKTRRRNEIDKVNAAVHDYMDRIDDKLNKMYGIPPSSAIQRCPSSYVSTDCKSREDRIRPRDKTGERWEADSSNSSLKADEVRQQYHSDIEPYDD